MTGFHVAQFNVGRIVAPLDSPQLADFVSRHQRVYVVEQNRDGQMLQLVRLELASRPELGGKLRSVLHYNGLPIDARFVTEQILAQERNKTGNR